MRSRFLIVLTVSMTGFVVSSGTLTFASTERYAKLAPYRGRTPLDLEKTLEPLRKRHGLPALGAAIVEGDDLRAIGATGVRAAGKPERVTVDDVWHLGSCTKAMTATLIARLVQLGVLDWNEPLDKPLRKMRQQMHASYRKVTLLQLLSNRGGTPASLVKDENLWSVLRTRKGPPDAARVFLARKILSRAPEVEPGSQHHYSNAGFAIAAAAAEAKTRKTWETLIQEGVFKPLKIKSAGFGAPGSVKKIDTPRGHVRNGERFQPVPPGPAADNPPAIFPAGGVHMTLADWARFAAFHLKVARGDKVALLKKEIAADLHKTHSGGDYALGWITVADPAGGQRMLTHAGTNTMWYAVIWIVPRTNRAILVTTNCYDEKVANACNEVVLELMRADLERE